MPSFCSRSCSIALARRANPPFGGFQPQDTASPMTSLVCRMVSATACRRTAFCVDSGVVEGTVFAGLATASMEASAVIGFGPTTVAGGDVGCDSGVQADNIAPKSSTRM